jgi:hypothetical protein
MHAKPKHISLSFTFCGNWRSVGSSSQTQGTTTWKTTPVATMADQKVVWFPGALPFRPAHHMHYSSWLKFEICPTSITIRIVLPMKRCLPVQVSSRRNWPTARPTACRSCTQIRCRKIPSLFSNTTPPWARMGSASTQPRSSSESNYPLYRGDDENLHWYVETSSIFRIRDNRMIHCEPWTTAWWEASYDLKWDSVSNDWFIGRDDGCKNHLWDQEHVQGAIYVRACAKPATGSCFIARDRMSAVWHIKPRGIA